MSGCLVSVDTSSSSQPPWNPCPGWAVVHPACCTPPHPPQGRCGFGCAVGEGPTGAQLAAPRRGELLPSRATRLDFPKAGVLGWVVFLWVLSRPPPSPAFTPSPHPDRIALRRMPSIRQTLQEMGVKVSDIFPELKHSSRSGGVGPRNGTAPTLLTNYLDVSVSLRRGFVTPAPRKSHPLHPTVHLLSGLGSA